MADTLESLSARVDFLEKWMAIPAVHLPGYVAPEPVAEEIPESEEPTYAEGNSQSQQLPVLDGQAE